MEAHIKKNKSNGTGTPAESQDPAVSFEQGSNSGLNVADSSGMDLTQGDFKLNNDEGTPFGKTGGYKSQSSYKDPSFPNPFGW